MHTQMKVESLIREACSNNQFWQGNAVVELDQEFQFTLSKPSQARLQALAEASNLSIENFLALLLEAALGDAHEGYMAAFGSRCTLGKLEKENLRLINRVSELL